VAVIYPPTQTLIEAFDAAIEGRRPGERLGPVVREAPKVGRNEPCPCGSGKKFKKCCG
jgi:preprotein translocase subunit SecA